MLMSPVENGAVLNTDWIQVRPYVSQAFGANLMINGKWVYREMGLKAHNGTDYKVPLNTPIRAICSGYVKAVKSSVGYGNHVKIRDPFGMKECVLGHLNSLSVRSGQMVQVGDLIGYSGSTGFSTGPHLHIGLRFIKNNNKDIWKWRVLNHNNGYFGYIDPAPYMVTWKGTLAINTLGDKKL